MANNNKKYSSINDQTAQQMRNNQNTLEILTKMDQALHSTESFVTVKTTDATGKETNSQIITVGYFKQKLDQLFKMVKVLSGVDGNPAALQIANNQFKRIVVADLNLEPKPIPALTPVTTFKSDPNWIFDAFLNPKISVELDLTDKISDDTRTIQSKRFIVEFDRVVILDENGNETIEYTEAGKARKLEFEQKYKGKSNIDMVEFVTWLDTPGLVNRVDDTLLDQDYFRVEPNRLQYKGDFTITSTDIDTLNKKLWYILDTLTYYDISDTLNPPKPIDLKIGDYVNVNPNLKDVKSTTVYKVVEISTITSEYRVRFEAVYGEEPIPVRLNALSIYSDKVKNRTVKVSVGFDDYSVLFVRQIDDINNLVGLDWSPGVGFWTNDLRLDNANGELFSEYYINKVYDYGLVLEDLVAKKVPNYYGIKPNAPVLDVANFKVVQINAHLTQTVEAEQIRDLHNNKNNLTSEIQQIQDTVEKTNRLIQTTVFDSASDRKRSEDELALLNNKLITKNQTKFSVVQDILASKKNLNKIAPDYHVRGFFPMPEAVVSSKTTPQEVVQFEIWYRKLSKSGAENPILTIPDLNNSAARTASAATTLNNTNISKPKTVNGAFSNWQKIKSDARKRSQDPVTGDWFWHIEDVSDANTPNINQVDIPISPGEKIEIRVKSLSEVGWPETPVESDFSSVITVEFPNDLNNVLNEDEFILKEAQADDIKVKFERDLESRGLNLHLNSALRAGDVYYAHRAEAIASGFKDSNGQIINLYDQLVSMVAHIKQLEETVNRAKGTLEVYLVKSGNKIRLFTGNNLTYNINLEDYMVKTKIGDVSDPKDSTSRTYKNEILQINDYSLLIKNSAETAAVGILSYRGYGQPAGLTPSRFAYDGASPVTTPVAKAVQPIWIQGDSTILKQEITGNLNETYLNAPRYATQQNNQWLWLQVRDINGKYIYTSETYQPFNNNWDSYLSGSFIPNNGGTGNVAQMTYCASHVLGTLHSAEYNLGFLSHNNSLVAPFQTQEVPGGPLYLPVTKITDDVNWSCAEEINTGGDTAFPAAVGRMATTIHPVISGFNDITDTSAQLTKYIKAGDTNAITVPIYIFAKPYSATKVLSSVAQTAAKNKPYVDTITNAGLGDFPALTSQNVTLNGSRLQLVGVNNSNGTIRVGDRLLLTGLTNALTLGVNNRPVRVTAVTVGPSVAVTVDYNASGLAGVVAEAGMSIVQVHKKYINSTLGPELQNFNVVGKIGGDTRYVTNYIEIVPGVAAPKPQLHTKKLRFYLEDENNIRPFEFQLNWNITQYKPVQLSTVLLGGGNNPGGNVINNFN
jgi:hypothetical protein